jgi:hypothetical protein
MRLLRTASHVAVASAVNGRVQRRQANRWAAADQAAAAPPVSAAPTAPAPALAPAPPAPTADPAQLVELLRQLGDLHAAGVLTDEEFAAQKSRLLA